MRHPTLPALALSSITLALTLGCGEDSDPLGSSANSPPDQAPRCTENFESHGVISLGISGGFGGLANYAMGVTRDGELIVVCPNGSRTQVQLPAETWNALLDAREAAHLHELGPEYLGEGADGYEYRLSDDGCSPPIRIHTDDYAMPPQLAELIGMLVRMAFDAQPPFGEECRRSKTTG